MNKSALVLGAIGLMMYFLSMKSWSYPYIAEQYRDLIEKAEKDNDLPRNLLARLLQQESDFIPSAYNPSGASGIAQIVPRYHPEVKDPYNPNEAIPYAGKYLKQLYNAFGYWDLALAAYNWGWGNVRKLTEKHGVNGFPHLPLETRNYVKEILADVKTL